MNILICDPISKKGIEAFQQVPEFEVTVLEKPLPEPELIPLVGNVNALVVRSETKVTRAVMEAAPALRIVGRAGVGVDNIDIEAASERGVVVMNTPGGNTLSTAELAFAMMMSCARKIPQANASIKQGQWNRKAYKGVELYGKTLGVLGMGRIGTEISRRALAFGMKVAAYDPYLSETRANELGVQLFEDLQDLFPTVDFLTVHMPLTDETRSMVDKAAFSKMKPTAYVINCARGGIINESDLEEALQAKAIAGAALDVYETEPLPEASTLRTIESLIMTPHLGASTGEAQENVGIEVAEGIQDYLLKGEIRSAINLPNMDAKTFALVQPYLQLGEKLGHLLAQISPNRNDRLVVTYGGKASELRSDPITRYVLKGFLQSAGGTNVNHINVHSMAKTLGLCVDEVKSNEETDFNEWIHVAAHSGEGRNSIGGTFFGSQKNPRLARINGREVEAVPEGVLLIVTNNDQPGVVGHVGAVLANANVNIANMSLSRNKTGGKALTVINLDSVPKEETLAELENFEGITSVKVAQL